MSIVSVLVSEKVVKGMIVESCTVAILLVVVNVLLNELLVVLTLEV